MGENAELDFFKKRLGNTESLLMLKQRQIDSVLEITRAITQNLPLIALARTLQATIYAQLGISKSALLIKSEEWECAYFQAEGEADFKQRITSYTQLFDGSKYLALLKEDAQFDMAIPVFFKDTLIGISLIGNLEGMTNDIKEEKIKFLQTIVNLICVANENKRLARKEVRQQVVERDLFLASEIQRVLIPTKFPENNHFKVSAFYKPYRNIGGDYYDFLKLSEHQYFFCMCDISGKGIAAAMLMANFQASLRFTIRQRLPLIEAVKILNTSLLDITKGDSFITAFFGLLDCNSCTLEYVNAGHNSPLLFNKKEVTELTVGCTILGIVDELPKIESAKVPIFSGTTLITYTDGLTEASNAAGELYGEERLSAFFLGKKKLILNF
jgi:sigma-B regulation protein RsbU (phosphoserine phosphatase)